jgi:predicted nucleic-acid-binding protein
MIAVDTNVLVRLLTGDDPGQTSAARSLFAARPIWIAKTVLLETGWVLRSLYGFEESAIREGFTKLLGLEGVHAEDESSVASALALTARGIELADAMHLTSRPPGATFVSFDQSFVRRATRAAVANISGVSAKGEISERSLTPGPADAR